MRQAKTRRRNLIRWWGGKGNILHFLLRYIPPHKKYIELFGGGAALLWAKKPAQLEVYNDIDGDLVNLFRVVQDEKLFPIFLHKVKWTVCSRELFYRCKRSYKYHTSPVERAYRFYIKQVMSWGGRGLYFATYIKPDTGTSIKALFNKAQELEFFHKRLQNVVIENLDWRECLEIHDIGKDCFIMMDPPYVKESRVEKTKTYKQDMSDEEHEELVDWLLNTVKGKVMLCGYRNKIYERLERNGWKRIDFETPLWGAPTKGENPKEKVERRKVKESIWINYKLNNLLI